jgi:hypothetical protein
MMRQDLIGVFRNEAARWASFGSIAPQIILYAAAVANRNAPGAPFTLHRINHEEV